MGFLFLLALVWCGLGGLGIYLGQKYGNATKIETFSDLAAVWQLIALGPISLYQVLQDIDAPLPWKKK